MKVLLAGAIGATPVVADALDRDDLLRAVDGRRADAVIHELTALRKPPRRHSGMAMTNRLRSEGTANLLAAAEALGARRFLTQSIVFGYGYHQDAAAVAALEHGHPGQASIRAANAKARAELGWHPACPTYHEGIAAMVSAPAPRPV